MWRAKNYLKIPTLHEIRSVLIVKLSSIGDVVHTLPVLSALKENAPGLKVGWIVEDRCADVINKNPYIDALFIFRRKEMIEALKKGLIGKAYNILFSLIKDIRGHHFDLSLDFQGLLKSSFWVVAARTKWKIGCYGLKEGSRFISHEIKEGKGVHAVLRNLAVIKRMGIEVESINFPIVIDKDTNEWVEKFLNGIISKDTPLVLFNLGASLPQKKWPAKNWKRLASILIERDIKILLLGTIEENTIAQELIEELPSIASAVSKTSLMQAAGIMSKADLMISADSGPIHIASAIGIPVIGLYGPDSPLLTGPFTEKKRVFYLNLPCSPCYKRPVCNGSFECMDKITPEDVAKAVIELLY